MRGPVLPAGVRARLRRGVDRAAGVVQLDERLHLSDRRETLAAARAGVMAQRAELDRVEAALREAGADAGSARREFLRAAREFTPFLVADTGETRYLIDPADPFAEAIFTKRQRREMRLLGRVQSKLEELGLDKGRQTFIDIGANIGTAAIDAVAKHEFERAVAFEPEPGNFQLLRINAILNGVEERVDQRNAALADEEGTAVLQVSSRNSGAHSLSGGSVGAVGTVEVPTLTLDGMAARGELDPDAASLMWMDIEGYEVHALQGATRLLDRGVPFVMELNPPVLNAAGRAGQLLPTLDGRYTHVANLGELGKRDGLEKFRPLAEVLGILEDASETKHIDVLVCRIS